MKFSVFCCFEMKTTRDQKIAIIILAVLVVAAIITVIILSCTKKPSDEGSDEGSDEKEGFYNAAYGSFVDPNSKTIKGPGIFTNGMVFNKPATSLLEDTNNDAYYAEKNQNLGAPKNKNGFNVLLENQKRIQNINEQAAGGVMSREQLREINQKLVGSSNSANNNLYNRSATLKSVLELDPLGKRGVIDGDYIPEREKNWNISVVGDVIPMPSFKLDTNRLDTMMTHQKNFCSYKANSSGEKLPAEVAMKALDDVSEEVIPETYVRSGNGKFIGHLGM